MDDIPILDFNRKLTQFDFWVFDFDRGYLVGVRKVLLVYKLWKKGVRFGTVVGAHNHSAFDGNPRKQSLQTQHTHSTDTQMSD